MRIVVQKYNRQWPKSFEDIKSVLWPFLKKDILAIEHVGSTSVPGLAAKAIIDIDLIIDRREAISALLLKKLKIFGYHHIGNLGISGREAFTKANKWVPFGKNSKKYVPHNLYVCTEDSLGLVNHINFRNYLRENDDERDRYGKLKEDLAIKYPFCIDKYVEGKTHFIVNALSQKGVDQTGLNKIINENKSKSLQ